MYLKIIGAVYDMNWKINLNAVNQFTKGTEIYTEGDNVDSIALVLRGRVLIHNHGVKYTVHSGCFLGISDLYEGRYQSTYTGLDEGVILVFATKNHQDIESILSTNKDYGGLMVAYLNRMIKEANQIYLGMKKQSIGLYRFIKEQYHQYVTMASKYGYRVEHNEKIENLEIPEIELEMETDRVNYYKECAELPLDVVKGFYSHSNAITLYQAEDQSRILNDQYQGLKDLSDSIIDMMNCLIDESNQSLFYLYTAMALEMHKSGVNNDGIIDICDTIIEKINDVEVFFEKKVGRTVEVNRRRMEGVYHLLLTGVHGVGMSVDKVLKYSGKDTQKAVEELKNSFETLLKYGEIEEEEASNMLAAMGDFISLKDKGSAEDHARIIRRKLTEIFYVLYKQVFIRAYKDPNPPRIVDMFLQYGYGDERLLTKERLLELYFLEEEPHSSSKYGIYTIKEWLTLIYEGKKQPSKNDLDQDYGDMIAGLKRQGQYTTEQLTKMGNDGEMKVDYEIQNMFRYNHKTTNGQISIFVPFLHNDIVLNDFKRSYVSKQLVEETIDKIVDVDYSAFTREVIYSNPEKNITKEYVVKNIYPDIILLPTVGSNGIMWQEISGKKKDTRARFLLPNFCEGNLHTILVKVIGRFRWEMCRTVEGMAWNDIKIKSLTSEYSDYLQFYKKNRDLSDEKKEKLKLQIQRARSSREVFAIDYEQWIHYESVGAIKLNKIVRELMATYCPFSKSIREQLMKQPIFEEAMARYFREKLKKTKELEARYRYLQKEGVDIVEEIIETLEYYKES